MKIDILKPEQNDSEKGYAISVEAINPKVITPSLAIYKANLVAKKLELEKSLKSINDKLKD
jgi:hypothetical protein